MTKEQASQVFLTSRYRFEGSGDNLMTNPLNQVPLFRGSSEWIREISQIT